MQRVGLYSRSMRYLNGALKSTLIYRERRPLQPLYEIPRVSHRAAALRYYYYSRLHEGTTIIVPRAHTAAVEACSLYILRHS